MALREKTAMRGHQRLLACTAISVIATISAQTTIALTRGRKRCQDPKSDIHAPSPTSNFPTPVQLRYGWFTTTVLPANIALRGRRA